MKGEEGPQNGEDQDRLPAKRPPGEINELDSDPEAQEPVPRTAILGVVERAAAPARCS